MFENVVFLEGRLFSSLLRFALMAGSSSQLTGVDHPSVESFPVVSVLGIIEAFF